MPQSDAQPKKQRSVPTLGEKLDVLDLLKGGMSVASVARKYGRNKSSIRAIKIRETEIRQAVASTAKDRVTVLLCGNAAGHLIKLGLLYRSANPHALKGKNKNLLPVFWQSNKKAWVTAATFLDWFHKCFILEVKQYLEEKGLDFKVLLLVDNAPGHPDAL
uniref:Uncharacterized protein n=1 Tax=Chelydra serpentina TaxID=8475 RepID=A0A8C3SSA6_CHESE